MTIHTINSPLQEILIQTCIIQVLQFKYQLMFEVMHQPFLMFQQITNTRIKHRQIKGFADKSIRAHFISFRPIFFLIFGSQQYHRNMTDFQITFHVFTKFDSIHFGHHHIRHDQIYILIFQYNNPFLTVFRRKYIIFTFQQSCHELQQLFIILYHQHRMFLFHHFRLIVCLHIFLIGISPGFLYRHNSLVINLVFAEIRAVNRNTHYKLCALSAFALYRNSTFMQLYQIFGERQTDSCPNRIELTIVAFIKTLKKSFLLLLRNALTVIFDFQEYMISIFRI